MDKQERLDRINAKMNNIMNSMIDLIVDLIVDVRALNEDYHKDNIIDSTDYSRLEEQLDKMSANLEDKRGE